MQKSMSLKYEPSSQVLERTDRLPAMDQKLDIVLQVFFLLLLLGLLSSSPVFHTVDCMGISLLIHDG